MSENQTVARALSVLDLLATSPQPLGVREIARQMNVAPSIAQRLIRTLSNAGYLEKTGEASRYTIGYRAFQIGNAFISQNSMHSAVMPELYALADQHINGFLGVLRGHSVVYLAAVQSAGLIALTHRSGSQTYLHSTALGKAILAAMPDERVKQLLSEVPLPRLTTRTKVNVSQLIAELPNIRRQGFATSDEENRYGVYFAGSVVLNSSNEPVGAISGGAPSADLSARERSRINQLVVAAARNASRRMGAPVHEGIGLYDTNSDVTGSLRQGPVRTSERPRQSPKTKARTKTAPRPRLMPGL